MLLLSMLPVLGAGMDEGAREVGQTALQQALTLELKNPVKVTLSIFKLCEVYNDSKKQKTAHFVSEDGAELCIKRNG